MKIVHQMGLYHQSFPKIKDGTKVVEIRLNDEKRQLLKIGDEIEFSSKNNSEEKLKVEVVELYVFSSFKELCESFPPIEYGSVSSEEYKDMYKYYSVDDENKYGVLAIRIIYIK